MFGWPSAWLDSDVAVRSSFHTYGESGLHAGQPAVDVLYEYDTGDAQTGYVAAFDGYPASGVACEILDDTVHRLIDVLQAPFTPAGDVAFRCALVHRCRKTSV